jgi:hypothetical protein
VLGRRQPAPHQYDSVPIGASVLALCEYDVANPFGSRQGSCYVTEQRFVGNIAMSAQEPRRGKIDSTSRVEKRLSGMDRVLTELADRVATLERKVSSSAAVPVVHRTLENRVRSLEEQFSTVRHAISEILGEVE